MDCKVDAYSYSLSTKTSYQFSFHFIGYEYSKDNRYINLNKNNNTIELTMHLAQVLQINQCDHLCVWMCAQILGTHPLRSLQGNITLCCFT